jgi:hypothetical protein
MSASEMFVPKRTKWGSLTDFRSWLQKETQESVVSFNGIELVTSTTRYTLSLGELCCEPAPKAQRVAAPSKPKRSTVKKIKSARYAATEG